MRIKAVNSKIVRRVVAIIVLVVTVTLSIALGNMFVRRNESAAAKEQESKNLNNLGVVLTIKDRDVPIIMYHSVNTYRPNTYVITPIVFENDLKFMLAAGYTPIFLSELTRFVEGKADLPRKPIVITFDDGFYNNYSHVLPILKKHKAKIVLSIVGMYTDREHGVEVRKNTYSYLNDSDIGAMKSSGLVEFCNHTYDLHHIGRRKGIRPIGGESPKAYEEMLIADTIKCEKVAARCGVEFAGYAYPYGYYSTLSERLLVEHGYKAILTCSEGLNKISRGDKEALKKLKRYNRPSNISTENFFKNKLSLIEKR